MVYDDYRAGIDPECPAAPNGTDGKRNETVMMGNTFRLAFAESWDGTARLDTIVYWGVGGMAVRLSHLVLLLLSCSHCVLYRAFLSFFPPLFWRRCHL